MSNQITIVSPLPGVFYRKPSPDHPNFVDLGQEVKVGDTIGLVEVMKNYYEIKAEQDGILERCIVEEGDVVDAGQEIVVLIEK
ncbi:acetyl-CoA carboxylase [Bacillus sp. PK3_68]|uniref:acetyl-CoA carboxylase n=1 Tax=Bacillus sp. PK3_68 TaxID=2027408 RepID=UPI000E72C4C0|nr:acetyl-CoA carboxylase [Bacillus sp. PK3_68]RJS50163.1 acetyl-CoA carboxylase biotin carboxyl carrier protein subunit [Bacillus sp. PK3_68]